MNLRLRAMQPADIRECVDIVANHPVIGPRYGRAIQQLPEAWLRLFHSEALNSAIAHAGEGSNAPICFFGVTVMVRDEFLQEMKRPPHFWLGPELTRRVMNGVSPILTSKQLREANSRDGLNLVCWEAGFRPAYEGRGDVQRCMMSGFTQVHRGYLWKEVISSQSWSADHLGFVLKTGGYLWDHLAGGYTTVLRQDLGEIVSRPHIVGITRDLELKRQGNWTGSWVGGIFDYHPPVVGFSEGEQRVLSHALSGATDERLAEMLGRSLPAIKKMWVSIYRRVEDYLPELIADLVRSNLPESGRGREKRRWLLTYLREHPEELRPVLPEVLSKSRCQMKMAASNTSS